MSSEYSEFLDRLFYEMECDLMFDKNNNFKSL